MTRSDSQLTGPADGGALRRQELADFLRVRRGNVQPEMHGLAAGARRRTAGLRREEVAKLLGVSASWYTKLEQGLDITTSPRLLGRLAEVLLLSPIERSQLLRLGLTEAGGDVPPDPDQVLPGVQRIIDTMLFSPALVLSPCADYVGANRAARAFFGEISEFAEGNQLRSMFLNDQVRRSLIDWDQSARQKVAMFRAAYARNMHDPRFPQLVSNLLDRSQEFRRIWGRYELPSASSRELAYLSRDGETLTFHYFTFSADLDGHFRVEVYHPLDRATQDHMAAVIGRRGAADRVGPMLQ